MKQKLNTVAKKTELTGVGLHSGEKVSLAIAPAPRQGIVFLRTDIEGYEPVKLTPESCAAGDRNTRVISESGAVNTVEHLLSAIYAHDITDVRIEIDGPELPAGDGSAQTYVNLLNEAGIVESESARDVITLSQTVTVEDGEASIIAMPAEKLSITYRLDLSAMKLGDTTVEYDITPETFDKRIAPARTFVPAPLAQELLKKGYGKGATEENTLLVGNGEERIPHEPATHKVLDLLGDLSPLGAPIHARIIATRTGHAHNEQLVKKLALEASLIEKGFYGLMEIKEIMQILPHRYPFLLVDRIIELENRKKIVAIKNVTMNEPFFTGHFPVEPVMPGVLQCEAMAQAAGIMMLNCLKGSGKLAFLMAMNKVKFRRPVYPGDQLVLRCHSIRDRKIMGVVAATAGVH